MTGHREPVFVHFLWQQSSYPLTYLGRARATARSLLHMHL